MRCLRTGRMLASDSRSPRSSPTIEPRFPQIAEQIARTGGESAKFPSHHRLRIRSLRSAPECSIEDAERPTCGPLEEPAKLQVQERHSARRDRLARRAGAGTGAQTERRAPRPGRAAPHAKRMRVAGGEGGG